MKSQVPLLICLALGAQAASTPPNAVLVLEKEQNTLVIVDPASLTIVARVPVGNDPHEVAVSDDGRTAYISNYGGGRGSGAGSTIAVVDLVGQKPLAPIELGALKAPHGLTFAGGKLYFTAEGAKVVGRYDPATQKIDWIMGTGQNRTHMVIVSKDLKTVFTSNVSSATISIIEQVAAQGPPPGRGPGGGPGGFARKGGPDGRGGPVPPGRGPGAPDWNVTNIAVGHGSEGFDLTPDGKELWVANAQDGTISIIDVAAQKGGSDDSLHGGRQPAEDHAGRQVRVRFGYERQGTAGDRRGHPQGVQEDSATLQFGGALNGARRLARLHHPERPRCGGSDRPENHEGDRRGQDRARAGRAGLGRASLRHQYDSSVVWRRPELQLQGAARDVRTIRVDQSVSFSVTASFVQNGVFTTKEKLGLVPDVELHARRSCHEDFL